MLRVMLMLMLLGEVFLFVFARVFRLRLEYHTMGVVNMHNCVNVSECVCVCFCLIIIRARVCVCVCVRMCFGIVCSVCVS